MSKPISTGTGSAASGGAGGGGSNNNNPNANNNSGMANAPAQPPPFDRLDSLKGEDEDDLTDRDQKDAKSGTAAAGGKVVVQSGGKTVNTPAETAKDTRAIQQAMEAGDSATVEKLMRKLRRAGIAAGDLDAILSSGVGKKIDIKSDKDSGARVWDFRHGKIPPGVNIIGEEPSPLEIQPDKATALNLKPKSYLRCELKLPANGSDGKAAAKCINDYSIIMDVKVDALPKDSISLFQANWGVRQGEGSAFISKNGGVGTFGEYGIAKTYLKPNKWTRIVMTLGGSWGANRRMTTFINAKTCATINKPILQAVDNQFAVNPESIVFFASTKEGLMPGLKVKYIEFRPNSMTPETVKEQATLNKIYSFWEVEKEAAEAKMHAGLSLSSLYKRPPPVWIHPAFLGEFGDAFLEGTGLEGGSLGPASAVLSLVLERALVEQRSATGFLDDGFDHSDLQTLDTISDLFKDAKDLCRKFALGSRSGAQLIFFMKYYRKRLESLKAGEFLIVPGGLGTHPLLYILENQDGSKYRFVIVNTHPLIGLQWHPATAEQQPKIKYKTCMALDNISPIRILDDAFWAFLFKLVVYPAKQNTPDKIYDMLLPWLVDKPLEAALVESKDDPAIEYRSPERASLAYFRVLLEAFHYLMRRKGISAVKTKKVSFAVRVQFLALVDNDLRYVPSVSDSDSRLIKMACEQVAYASVKLAKKNALSPLQLAAVKKVLDNIDDRVLALPCDDLNSTAPPPKLLLDEGKDAPKFDQWQLHPFFERLRRVDSVDGLAGPPIRLPKYVPIDMLQLPARVTNFEEAVAAIRYCDKMCTLISVQAHCVKNTAFLKCALMEHTFTQVVPVPKPRIHPEYKDCVWAQPLRYALQLDILLLLQRVSEHWASSAFTLQVTRSFDSVKIILPGVFAAIADAVLRKKATDIPSEVSLHLMGYGGRGSPFGISIGKFHDQSETIEVHTAELNVARTSVLDYFVDLGIDPQNQIFAWENGNNFEPATNQLMGQVCTELAFDTSSIHTYLSGEQYLIIKNYPEWALYRDVCFWFKYFCNCELEAFPPPAGYLQKHAELKWEAKESYYKVTAFGNMPLFCKPTPPKVWTHRFPSTATPSFLTHPHPAKTEDDVLHIKNLPSFGEVMGQRDAELLISYLTVPYLRLPLCMTFFSTEDRIHCLKSKQLQDVLDSVMFEPGRYLLADMKQEPREVPSTNPKLLATPYGMLLNELQRSPDGVIGSVLRLVKLALDLDTGTVKSSTVDIILYVIRLAARFDNYLSFLIEHTEKTHECINFALRDVVIYPRVLKSLKDGRAALRVMLRGAVHKTLEAWCYEAMKEIENKISERIVDDNTKIACTLHAHLLLLYRNVLFKDLTEDNVSTVLSSFIFLTTRHTWNMLLLPIPETEMFELLQVQRRKITAWFHDSASQKAFDFCMESAVRVSTGTGIRIPRKADPNDVMNQWAFISGPRSLGRFTVLRSRRRRDGQLDTKADEKKIQNVADTNELGVEIDLQTIQLTLRSAHLKALDKAIAGHPDVQLIFGSENMQAATIESAQHRDWVRLVGRNHDIQHWKTPDPRPEIQILDRDYVPGELEDTENWIIPIFEPVRLTYCMKPFPLQICLPEKALPADAQVAIMVGIHPKMGGTWKEFFICRQRRVVFCYDVMSHGRRFYRSLVYCSDTRFAYRDMQPSPAARQYPWPVWERHGTGHPYASHPDPTSVVITRSKDLPSNQSGTEETFMPSRILAGLIPDALLDTHHFWQDEKDNLIGYPHDASPHIIKVELVDMKKIDSTRDVGCCARIRRIPTIKAAEPVRDEKGGVISDSGAKRAKTIDEEELTLLNLLYAPEGSKLQSLAQVLSRVERLSYVLAWTKNPKVGVENENYSIDLVDLPRIKINFAARKDEKGITRLYSIDHVSLYVTNARSELTTRLICGIPHSLLLSNDNNEVMIMVPSVHPARPQIGSAPFSTELVLYRTDGEWINTLDTRYYLYPVHVSLSFMFTPTLASALYLLLLRFLYRDYNEVFRLVNTIGTDTEFSSEEQYIFQTLGSANSDCHPNAHACRLKISLVTIDSPVVPPWNLTTQMSRYITKISHVSATCRMSHYEEYQLLEQCITDVDDPRFDPKIYTEYEVTLIKNRKYYIRAYLDMPAPPADSKAPAPLPVTSTFLPPRFTDSGWPYHADDSAFYASAADWSGLTVNYAPPKLISGPTALDTMHAFWNGKENMTGSVLKFGFLYIYGLLTGTNKAKILSNDDSFTTATLLTYLMRDYRQRNMMSSILNLIIRNPHLANILPQFRDKRKYKNDVINGHPDEKEDTSPTADLFEELIPKLMQSIGALKMPPDNYPRLAAPRNLITVLRESERDWVLPVLSDFACGRRVLSTIPSSGLGLGREGLALDNKELSSFTTSPLAGISLEKYVTFLTRAERKAAPIEYQLPFDVTRHSQAKSEVAKSMIARLHSDMKVFADAENSGKAPRLVQMLDDDIKRYVQLASEADAKSKTAAAAGLTSAIAHVEQLIELLSTIRDADNQYVTDAIPYITETANGVKLPAAAAKDNKVDAKDAAAAAVAADSLARYTFILNRYCGQDTILWLDYLIGSLLSSRAEYDLQKLNPYFESKQIGQMFDVISGVILHANRVGQTNRSISDAKDVLALLRKCSDPARKSNASDDANLQAGLLQKGESLAKNLATKRYYVDRETAPGDEKKDAVVTSGGAAAAGTGPLIYDPRFLVFEFTWNIILRKMQVVLVRDFMDNMRKGKSTVKQMIMGQGKTTVVGPLLALMLGDGNRLVTQVVPPALLEFSRSVMRSTFSSIMHKRIYTLSFDRASKADPRIFKKLYNAIQTKGVVISTPTAVKSLQLKFLELLNMVEDDSRPRTAAIEIDARELGKSLKLFKDGILIMDEVDLILHPLKSELNFPIGAKLDLDFNPLRWKLPIHILDAIFYAERGRMSVGFKQSRRAVEILAAVKRVLEKGYEERALQRNPHVILLNPDYYHAELKPVMVEWVAMWLETQHIAGIDEQQIRQYIRAGASGDSKDDQILAEAVNTKLSVKHKKMLNLSKDWLKSFLPHVLQKIDRVSFGILNKADYDRAMAVDPHMPRTRAKLAIPFVGKDVPSRSSEFAHPDVIIGLTILAYRYEGLRSTDFTDIISALRTTLSKEMGPFNERKSSLRYASWVREAGGKIKGQVIYRDENEDEDSTDAAGAAGAGKDEKSDKVMKPAKLTPRKEDKKAGAAAGTDSAASGVRELTEDERTEVVPLRLLKRSNEEQMEVLFKLLYKLPDLIHWYLTEFIFPAYMRHQIVKLSSSGQEVGGDALFGSRMGFSGTPSDLLPVELGRCGYEAGSDGQVIHTMTNPEICSYSVQEEGWSVRSLLNRIARTTEPPFHALIDTGALITGMTNAEVAAYLLDNGLPWCEGVVFLDELDRKMILIRATRRVLKLEQCGISLEKRFAFYDQVHTTGMDIKHRLNAKAVLTLGKDMVFRDFAQGAFRMRGIGAGQTIHLFIIPEVQQLIARELKAAKMPASASTGVRKVLEEVSAWLVINSMRSERVQFNMLCVQNTSNVWRKHAYGQLLQQHERFTIRKKLDDSHLRKCNALFREPIDFSVEGSVPKPRIFSETIAKRVEEHREFILTPQEWATINHVQQIIKGTSDPNRAFDPDELNDEESMAFDREMVQEMEEEKERQQEQEQEQEIEIEKYVDLMYQRDHEEPVPWPFASLKDRQTVPQFYPQNQFNLYKRAPLKFSDYLLCSNNYFDKRWSGARRIKNIVIVMEWTPSASGVATLPPGDPNALGEARELALKKAFQLFDSDASGDVNAAELLQVIRSAVDQTPTQAEVEAVIKEFGSKANGKVGYEEMRAFLTSGKFRKEQSGRYFVALSLAEAETIRRIMHIRLERPILDGTDAHIALHCVPAENALIDVSHRFELAPAYQGEVAHQSFRFFDCDMYYKESALNVLLRALQASSIRERMNFFQQVIGCRRRGQRKWEETPLAKLFTLPDEFHLLKQRAQSVRTREAIKEKGMLLYDAFRTFDLSRNGMLSPPELYGALEWLGISLSPNDILDFVRTADTDKDGNINYREFVEMLRDPDAKLEDLEKEGESNEGGGGASRGAAAPVGQIDSKSDSKTSATAKLSNIKIAPKGERELRELQLKLIAEEKAAEDAERAKEDLQELRIRREISEEDRLADEKQPGGPNPKIDVGRCRYDFSTGRPPRGVGQRGQTEYKPDAGKKYLHAFPQGVLYCPAHFAKNGGGNYLNQFTITIEFKVKELPAAGKQQALLQFPRSTPGLVPTAMPTAAPTAAAAGDSKSKPVAATAIASSASTAAGTKLDSKSSAPASSPSGMSAGSGGGVIYIRSDGGIGCDGTFGYDTARLGLQANRWTIISISVDTIKGETVVFVNGKTLCAIRNASMKRDGPFALAGSIALFSSREVSEQLGGGIKFLILETKSSTAADARAMHDTIQAEGSWACDSCTVRNFASSMVCHECGTKRPIELSGGWLCKTCTFANPASRDDCEVCQTPKAE